MPGLEGYYYALETLEGAPPERAGEIGRQVEPLLSELLRGYREALQLGEELAVRYAEIELLYTISETLGQTHRLEAAAELIVREVARVFGCRRCSILVLDPGEQRLKPVAGFGVEVRSFPPIPLDDPFSPAARAFREARTISRQTPPGPMPPGAGEAAGALYRTSAFLCVPIVYPEPGGSPRPIGVLNLTEREGTDRFSESDQKLVTAIANQIGAALENARLVEQDLARQRLERELELARHLQRKLLGLPLADRADIAARCLPAATVGGDFYRVIGLDEHTLGVMLGDVSSHGFAAALIMALVLSAAGIHATAAHAPAEVMRRLHQSVASELEETEMYLSLFYGVVDRKQHRLRYANAGHPHAFRLDRNGAVHRLEATMPPLGLAPARRIASAEIPWKKGDLLLLFTDGLLDRRAGSTAAAERLVLKAAVPLRQRRAQTIVDALLSPTAQPGPDDQTLLVLKA